MVYLHGCTEPFALIHIENDKALVPLLHGDGLLLEGKHQILFQAPVQKSPELSHLLYGEQGYLSHLHHRLFGGRYQPVPGIPVHENGQAVIHLYVLRHLLCRKKHLFLRILGSIRQIYAEFNSLDNCQYLLFSYLYHNLTCFLSAMREP